MFYFSGIPLLVACAKFVLGSPQHFSADFHLTYFAVIKRHGIGGRTVTKMIQRDLHVLKSFKPDLVIIRLGSNVFTSETALRVGSSTDVFVKLLHDLYHVKVIYVCQTIMRQGQSAFNRKAKLLTKYLRVVLEPVPSAHFWGHRGFGALLTIHTFVMVCMSTLGAGENSIVALEEQFWEP